MHSIQARITDECVHQPTDRFSDKYPFRMRSETPDIAIELSMQVGGGE